MYLPIEVCLHLGPFLGQLSNLTHLGWFTWPMIANRFVQLPGLLGCGLGFKFRPMRFPRPTEARKHCAPTKVPHLLHLHDINYIRITSFFSNRREGKQYFHEYQTWTYLSSLTKVQAALFNPLLALESHSFFLFQDHRVQKRPVCRSTLIRVSRLFLQMDHPKCQFPR